MNNNLKEKIDREEKSPKKFSTRVSFIRENPTDLAPWSASFGVCIKQSR